MLSCVDVVSVLKNSALFGVMSDKELKSLYAISHQLDLGPGEFLIRQGDIKSNFYVVIKGRLKKFSVLPAGREIMICFFEPGNIIGPLAALSSRPAMAMVKATTPCTVLSIDVSQFYSLAEKNPVFAVQTIKILALSVRQLYHRLVDVLSLPVVERITKNLLLLSKKYGSEVCFSRDEIACMSGTTVETVIRVTTCLMAAGIVKCTTRKIIIVDEAKLKLVSEGKEPVLYYSRN